MPSTPPTPTMEPAPSSLAGRIRAGASEKRQSAQKPEKPNAGQWAPGATGRTGIPNGHQALWAHPSNSAREAFVFSAEFSCPACTAPLRQLASGGWQCWGCTMSVTSLAVRRRVIKLWAEGPSASAIGEVVGLSKSAVIGLVKRIGLPGRPSPLFNGGARPASPKSATAAKLTRTTGPRWIAPKKFASRPPPVFDEPVRPPCVVAADTQAVAAPGGSADVAGKIAPTEPMGGLHNGFYTHCQYPTGRRLFCELPSQTRSNYCPDHHRRCFAKAA